MRRDTVLAGIGAGLIAGVVFGVMMQMMTAPTPEGARMPMMAMVAKVVRSDSMLVGWLYHLANSAVIGAIFGWIAGHISGYARGLGWGALYGAAWWVIGDLRVNVAQVRFCDGAHFCTRSASLVGETEKLADLRDGEPERAGTPDEVQTLHVLHAIQAISAHAPPRRRQEADAFVEPDRLHVRVCPLRDRPDGNPRWILP